MDELHDQWVNLNIGSTHKNELKMKQTTKTGRTLFEGCDVMGRSWDSVSIFFL